MLLEKPGGNAVSINIAFMDSRLRTQPSRSLAFRARAGPFASVRGVGRAEPEWADLNQCKGITGKDAFFASGETTEAPLPLPAVRNATHPDPTDHRRTPRRTRTCIPPSSLPPLADASLARSLDTHRRS